MSTQGEGRWDTLNREYDRKKEIQKENKKENQKVITA
jgi:hypothetical protein